MLAGLPEEQQREIAERSNFKELSVFELGRQIKQIRGIDESGCTHKRLRCADCGEERGEIDDNLQISRPFYAGHDSPV
jgi:hypothetical protein